MYVTFLLDVEDVVTPAADDIARDLAQVLTEESVRATFCVVGERVRQWIARGRNDVIEALAAHDIGTHTDLHSVHPTVLEYLEGKGWQDGIEEAVCREAPAVHAIRAAFRCQPSCWGGPGNTWGPQVTAALERLDVPAVVYAHTRTPSRGPHRFLGLLAYPAGHYAGDGDYHDPGKADANRQRLMEQLRSDMEAGLQWTEVFLGHPTRILHHEFWDGCNFARGENPPPSCWRQPRRKTDAELDQAIRSFRLTVRSIADLPGVELRTIREMNGLLSGWRETPVSSEDMEPLLPEMERNVRGMAGWVILPEGMSMDHVWAMTRVRLESVRDLQPNP